MAKASAMSAAGPEPEWRMGDRQLLACSLEPDHVW